MALERCVTGMAYEMRLVLQGIYQWKDVGEAKSNRPALLSITHKFQPSKIQKIWKN